MNPTDLPLMHQAIQVYSSQQHCEFYTEFSDHVSLYLSADKCNHRSAIPKASTRFSSQHSAVSHFVNCRFFPRVDPYLFNHDASSTLSFQEHGMQNEVKIILCRHQVVDRDLFYVSSTLCFLVMWPYTVRLTSANADQLKAKHPRSSSVKVKDNEAKIK
ncbi:unnamed protein product [Clavelina lepadiformis]|uniref:Uncharacterized protein n=1 Tax=Clavelina lepadiformis TaxID=159417 RepID=A0ABP0GHR7_CLALP